MKARSWCVVIVLMTGLIGCGEDAGTATSGDGAATRGNPGYPLPRSSAQEGPLEKLVIRDLKVGTGPVARWGDEATVRYVGVNYENGEVFTESWETSFSFDLDGEWLGPGWQKGIHGMRVGGRRELLIPSALYGDGRDVAYVVALRDVKPGATN